MELLRNVVRPYAWGSRTAIAELLGDPVPAPHPQAELWLGAHPADPSMLLHADGAQTSLLEALHTDPDWHLGTRCAELWGKRLPFLLKVLAAEEPLSLQAHPSAEQAAEGFAREEARGIPRDAPERNYPDASHKPELICALTEFHALVGFRNPMRTVELLAALDSPSLEPYRALLAAAPDAIGLRTVFTTWITMPQPVVDTLLPSTLDACIELLRREGDEEFRAVCREVLALAEAHSGDMGVLAALLLNRVVLQPGEALYLPAGNLHTYLRGTGVEIMANSDNVLRGGLTAKHVDVPELLRVLDFEHCELSIMRGEPVGSHEIAYATPAEEFRLSRLEWARGEMMPVRLHSSWPQILLCTRGSAELRPYNASHEVGPRGISQGMLLHRGGSAWLAAGDPDVLVCPLDGPVQIFRARPGLATDHEGYLPDL